MWTLADLADELDLPEARVRFWVAAGLLRAGKAGRLSDAALHRFLCTHPHAWADGRRTPWIAALLTDPDLTRGHACGAVPSPVTARVGPWNRYADLLGERS